MPVKILQRGIRQIMELNTIPFKKKALRFRITRHGQIGKAAVLFRKSCGIVSREQLRHKPESKTGQLAMDFGRRHGYFPLSSGGCPASAINGTH